MSIDECRYILTAGLSDDPVVAALLKVLTSLSVGKTATAISWCVENFAKYTILSSRVMVETF